jgi:hypothetical protein
LLLCGVSEKQISELEASGKSASQITFYSPEAGYVTEVKSRGMYVEEGTLLIKITSLNQVWVEAQFIPMKFKISGKQVPFRFFPKAIPKKFTKAPWFTTIRL